MAFKIAEDHRVVLPMIVNLDGFILSHVVEAHELLDQETVDQFLPPLVPYHKLDPAKPVTMGAFAMPELYTECKYGPPDGPDQFLRPHYGNLEGMGRAHRPAL